MIATILIRSSIGDVRFDRQRNRSRGRSEWESKKWDGAVAGRGGEEMMLAHERGLRVVRGAVMRTALMYDNFDGLGECFYCDKFVTLRMRCPLRCDEIVTLVPLRRWQWRKDARACTESGPQS